MEEKTIKCLTCSLHLLHNSQQLNLLGSTFDIVSGCCSNHKRTGSLIETRMAMLHIYSSFHLPIKFKSYTLFYDDHDIHNIR